jgi:high-affinity Fe2+/Pb2+ permease
MITAAVAGLVVVIVVAAAVVVLFLSINIYRNFNKIN